MRKYEVSAGSVEEAVEKGLQELGVGIGDIEYQVIQEGSKGLFGLFGSRQAKISITVKEEEEDPLKGLLDDEKPAATPAPKKAAQPTPPAEKKPEAKKPAEEAAPAPAEKDEKPAEKDEKPVEPEKEALRPAPVKRVANKKKEKPEKKAESPAAEPRAEEAEEKEPREIKTLEKPEITVIPADQLDPESPAGVACAFLQEITKLMGVEVSIEMGTDAEGNVYGSMTGDTLGILIGRRGETLDALQYLTSLKVNRGREGYTRVTLDTENYRAKREDTLIRLANRMANRATRTGRRVSLEPMNPYERRIIHYALQGNEQVDTHSEGDEPNRHVVITVKK